MDNSIDVWNNNIGVNQVGEMARIAAKKIPSHPPSARQSEDSSRRTGGHEFSTKSGEEILEIITSGTSKAERSQKYRSRHLEVLLAAAKLFSKKGYRSATTTDIADELRIHQTSLYYYIKSKDQALEQICEGAIEGYVRFSQLIKERRAPIASKLRELVLRHLKTLKDRPDLFRVFLRNRKDLGADARHKIGVQIRIYEKNVESIMKQGVRSGDLRSELNTLHAAMALITLCNSVSDWWQTRSSEPIEKIAGELADIFISGVATSTKNSKE
jgi:AcrR family transcriptional regulator